MTLKPPSPPIEYTIRDITRDDLPRLAQPRDKSLSYPKRLRASHHRVAELIAMGFDLTTTAALTGYNYNRVSQLAASPAMQELIAVMREEFGERRAAIFDSFAQTASNNMMAAERMIGDHIAEADEAGDLLPLRELVGIVKDRADRFGYPRKSTNVNLNIDMAARLEAAIKRSGQVVDHEPGPGNQPPSAAGPAPVSKLRRIA